MRVLVNQKRRWVWASAVLTAALLAWSSPVAAQSRTGSSTGSTSSGSNAGRSSGSSGSGTGTFTGGSSSLSSGTGTFTGVGQGSSGSFTGMSGSGSFTGGTGSFTGSSGSFTGGTGSFTGGAGSFTGSGGFSGRGTSTQGGVSTPISSTGNAFASSYANPIAKGMPNASSFQTFGTPLYATITTGQTSTLGGGRLGGGLGSAGGGGLSGLGGIGATTSATRGRAPAYTATIGWERPPVIPTQGLRVHAELQQVLGRSTMLSSGRNIQVLSDGQAVVLHGTVNDDRSRRLAENILRLEPGVREVHNKLEIRGKSP